MKLVLAAVAVLTVSCVPTPEYYSPPPPHVHSGADTAVGLLDAYFRVEDPDAQMFLVKDVEALEGSFRWTHAEPEFRFFLNSTAKVKFTMEFSVHDVTFKDTGPLSIALLVNGREIDTVRYDEPGRKLYVKPVPSELLRRNEENRVLVRVLNPWRTGDGAVLGIILHAAGFTE
jgi:hypothetical protein